MTNSRFRFRPSGGGFAFFFAIVVFSMFARADDALDLNSAWSVGKAQYVKGNFAEAAKFYAYALKLAEQQYGPDSSQAGMLVNNLAVCYDELGRYAESEPLCIRSVKIQEASLVPNHPEVAASLVSLGVVEYNLGKYPQAELAYLRSLRIRETALGTDNIETAETLNDLALLYVDLSRYARAEPLFQRALDIRRARLGGGHPLVANTLVSMGLMHYEMGQYALALQEYQKGLAIREAKLAKNHPFTIDTLLDIANAYSAMQKYDEAEPLLKQVVSMYEDRFGPDQPSVANALNNLAQVYRRTGRDADAEPLYKRGLKIQEATLGPNHPRVAATLCNMGLLYQLEGKFDLAAALFRRSKTIWQTALGPDSPDAAGYPTQYLAVVYAAMGRWTDAADEIDQVRRVFRRHVARTLPVLSERQQLNFLEYFDRNQLSEALSLALVRREDPNMPERSSAWVLNAKGVAQQCLAERTLLARDSDDPALVDTVQRLNAVRNLIATLSLSLAKPGQEDAKKAQLDKLIGEERTLSRKLGMASGGAENADPWVEAVAVRKSLPKDAVLIEFAHINFRNFQAQLGAADDWQPARYIAWVIPADEQGKIELLDLGDAKTIDAAVAVARKAIQGARNSAPPPNEPKNGAKPSSPPLAPDRGLEFAPEKSNQAADAAMRELAKLVFDPLAAHFGQAKRLILSPDAALWLIPWAALPMQDGKYVVEKYKVSYVISGRYLLSQANGSAPANAPVVFADPNYDLSPEESLAATAAVLRESSANQSTPSGLFGLSSALPKVPRLPGTAIEAAAIKPKLRDYAQADPIEYMDMYALEGVFKALHRPKVVVLSTHGFVLEDQEVAPAGDDNAGGRKSRGLITTHGKPVENPLLRCGLLLAGCNQQPAGEAAANGNDGILTGLEIIGTDLRGTDLVVLSACETGLGKIQEGEGVAGLRQAFQLAGAGAVVATLWQIPDRESAQLMGDFFANLSAGQEKADALCNAQLAFIKQRREQTGAAPPLFWAAFTLTGR